MGGHYLGKAKWGDDYKKRLVLKWSNVELWGIQHWPCYEYKKPPFLIPSSKLGLNYCTNYYLFVEI